MKLNVPPFKIGLYSFIVVSCIVFFSAPTLAQTTYYSYQNGDWQNSLNWTLDPSGTTYTAGPALGYPVGGDEAVILNGVTITANVSNLDGGTDFSAVEVQGGGVLDFAGTINHDIAILRGEGRLRFSGNGGTLNFPNITNTAAEFQNGNGEVELYGANPITLNTTYTFPSLIIDMDATGTVVDLEVNYTLNQDLQVRTGTFRFADVANFTLEVLEDIRIEAAGRIETETGGGNRRHELNLYGDFLNLGYVRFSNRTVQDPLNESTDVKVDFSVLSDNRNQEINCNGETYFYRIVVFKGTDDTYSARFQASAPANFRLTGPVNFSVGPAAFTSFPTVPTDNPNAFALITGNAIIGNNVAIDPINEGTAANQHFKIGEGARLTVDGGLVANRNNAGSITLYGTLDVRAGTVISEGDDGLSLRLAGTINISGGTVNTVNIKTASNGGASNFGGYIQSGGVVNIGTFAGSSGANGSFHQLELPRPTQAFIMSGGTLNIQDATAPDRGLLFINSDPGNISVTGGTVNLITNNANPGSINSKAPFYNLIITNATTTTGVAVQVDEATVNAVFGVGLVPPQDLKVLNDLTITTGITRTAGADTYGSYLDLCPDGVNCVNLEVGRNLTIQDNAVLDVFTDAADDAGSATLTFNGNNNGVFYIGNITTYTSALVDYDAPDGRVAFTNYEFPL